MSKFLSLEWFKERIESSIDKVIEKTVTKRLNSLMEEEEEEQPIKLYQKIKFVNNVLTVILNDGTILSKSDAIKEDYDGVINASSEQELFFIISNKKVKEETKEYEKELKKCKAITKGIPLLLETGEFKEVEGALYFKGNKRSIPQLLVEELLEVILEYTETYGEDFSHLENHDQYQSLKRFFTWACLNPRAEVANDLFDFLKENSFRITKQGFFVALRNVVSVGEQDKSLVEAISNFYNKVKAVWKSNPSNYRVVSLGNREYTIEKVTDPLRHTIVGNLETLYLDLPNMSQNRYTDAHTRTFDIRVGQIVNMPPEKCNWSTADCAHAGLHFTSDEIHYVGCGDTSVIILINPMKVVGIGTSKGRCYEYLPIMTVPREEATKILHDGMFDTLELDEQYAINELENLVEKAKEGFAAEVTKHNFNLPSMSSKQILKLAKSLDQMKKEIVDRVKTL